MMRKIELENLIFFRAKRLNTPIFAKKGRLLVLTHDACLRTLVDVYNYFFADENCRKYAEIEPWLWEEFFDEATPFLTNILPFQDIKQELFVENYFKQFSYAKKQKNIDKKNKI